MLRSDGTGLNYYYLDAKTTTAGPLIKVLVIAKRSGGSVSDLSSPTANNIFADGDTITFRAVGTTLTALVNGVQVLQVTGESSFSSGALGIAAFSNAASAGNYALVGWWEGYDSYGSLATPPGHAVF